MIRLLIFLFFELWMLPIQLTASAIYAYRLKRKNRPLGISGTAYEPFFGRLFMHAAGTRPDEASFRMAPHLPALSPLIVWIYTRTLGLATRLSGYRGWFFAYPPKRPSSLATIVNHRTHFLDVALGDFISDCDGGPIAQVVILGTGWDGRAYGRPATPHVRWFEVDMPATLQAKQQAIAKSGLSSDHVTFVETDFNQTSWLDMLNDHGFDSSLPTFILWEGVTMYLDEASVRNTLSHVANFSAGSRIAFDFLSDELVQSKPPFVRIGKYIQRSIKFYGESFHFGLSTKPPAETHVDKLIESTGLELKQLELFGREDGNKMAYGGLVLGIVPAGNPSSSQESREHHEPVK